MRNLWLNRVISKGRSLLSGSRDGARHHRSRRPRRRGAGSSGDSAGRWQIGLHPAKDGNGSTHRDIFIGDAPPPHSNHAALAFEKDLLNQALPEYEILDVLDFGGQGTVYRATQRSTGRVVALKVLHHVPGGSGRREQRFAREVEIVSRLSHPHIVTIFDSGVAAGRPYLSMELIDGLAIDDFVLLNRPTVRQCVELFEKICRAVASVHQRGVIHRDLKPGNILVNLEGVPHILDFGLAKCFDDEQGQQSLSVAGQVVGTLPFASPEQITGDGGGVDIRTDIHALGVILHLLLTGDMPYEVDCKPQELAENIVKVFPSRLERKGSAVNDAGAIGTISSDLSHIVLKALAKEKDRRYQSADALADDLRRYLDGGVIEARGDGFGYLLRVAWRKYRVHSMVAAAFVLLLAGSAISMGYMWRKSEQTTRDAQNSLQLGSYSRLGSLRRDEKRTEQAIDMCEKAIEVAGRISKPQIEDHRAEYAAHHYLAEVLLKDSLRRADCQHHCNCAVRIASALLQSAPDEPEYRRLLGYSYRLRGRFALLNKQYEDAEDQFRYSATLFNSIVDQDQMGDASHLSFEVANSRQYIGRALLRNGNRLAALDILRDVQIELSAIWNSHKFSMDYLISLLRTESLIAEALMLGQTPSENEQCLKQLEIAEAQLKSAMADGLANARLSDTNELAETIRVNLKKIRRRMANLHNSSTPIQLTPSSSSGVSAGLSSSSSIGTGSSDR